MSPFTHLVYLKREMELSVVIFFSSFINTQAVSIYSFFVSSTNALCLLGLQIPVIVYHIELHPKLISKSRLSSLYCIRVNMSLNITQLTQKSSTLSKNTYNYLEFSFSKIHAIGSGYYF